jgi:hypothetical protein
MNLIGTLKTNKGNIDVYYNGYPYNTITLHYPSGQWSNKIESPNILVCDILDDVKKYVSKYFDYVVKEIKINV